MSLLSAVKTAGPKLLASIAVATAALIFGPPGFLEALGMKSLVEEFRGQLGLAFLIATALLLGELAWWYAAKYRSKQEQKLHEQHRVETLKCLTAAEKACLLPYIANGQNTMYYSIEDGVAGGLRARGVLYMASNLGGMDGFAFNMQPWAREHLVHHPEFLEGAALDAGAPGWKRRYR